MGSNRKVRVLLGKVPPIVDGMFTVEWFYE